MRTFTMLATAATSALMYMPAQPATVGHSTNRGVLATGRAVGPRGPASATTGRTQEHLLAWCEAMGGYPSFEAQAAAQARAARRSQAKEDQTALKRLGYYGGPVDGQSGPDFRTAIRNFRRENGLPAGGNLDYSSRELLTSGNAKSMSDESAKLQVARARNVQDQTTLQRLGYFEGEPTGQSSAQFRTAIAEFRKANGLGGGTKLDETSRQVLNGDRALSKLDWQERESSKVIKGDQQALQNLGYYKGVPSGKATDGTAEAIRRFKSEYKLDPADAQLDDASRATLHAAEAETLWIRNSTGDGVTVMKVSASGDGAYRIRTASGDHLLEAERATEVQGLVEKALAEGPVRKVYLDLSELPASRGEAFEASLKMAPKSSVRYIRTQESRDLLFSRRVELTEVSPVTQVEGEGWQSTIKLSNPKPVSMVLRVLGKTRELTTGFVDRLRDIYKRNRKVKPTLGGSLNRVREMLKEERQLQNDDDLIIDLRNELNGIETTFRMQPPPGRGA